MQGQQDSKSFLQESATYSEELLQWDAMFHYYSCSDPIFEQRLPHAFRYLVSPNVSEGFLLDWTENIRKTLTSHLASAASLKHSPDWPMLHTKLNHRFVALCLSNGIISTMFDVSRLKAHQHNSASYMAVEVISYLCQSADQPKRMNIYKEVLSKNGFRMLLDDFTNSAKFAQRAAAAECLEKLLSLTPLSDDLTPSEISDLLLAATTYNLRSHKHIVQEVFKPDNLYMEESISYIEHTGEGGPVRFRFMEKILKLVPIWFSTNQEFSLMACIAVLSRKSGISRQQCLEINKKNPQIVHHLLVIASSTRSALCPGRVSDSIAAKLLCHLTHALLGSRFNAHPEDDEDKAESKAAYQCYKSLYETPSSLQMQVRMRNKMSSEDKAVAVENIWKQWKELGDECNSNYSMAQFSPARGTLGICALYLFNDLPLLPATQVRTLLPLLPVAYVACARVPTEAECDAAVRYHEDEGLRQRCTRQERHSTEIPTSSDLPSQGSQSISPVRLFIPPETVLGPTLLFNLLARLALFGYTPDVLREMKAMPPDTFVLDTHPTPLIHIHQIVEPRVIGKLIRMSVHRRIPMRRELGNRLLVNEPDLARVTYLSAGQLAQAIVDFGREPQVSVTEGVKENVDSIRRAYQEVVLCAGNACEAAAKMKEWGMAQSLAQDAISWCDSFPTQEAAAIGWDLESSRQKNIRRMEKILQECGE